MSADMNSTESAAEMSSKRRLTEIHLIAARERALRLFNTTSTIFPAEWATREIIEITVVDASEFAYHARRVIDLCGFRDRAFELVDQTRFVIIPSQEIILISDFHRALNRLHHARDFVFHWAVLENRPKIFLASPKEMVISFLRIGTKDYGRANISLYGVAFAFLNGVIKMVKEEFPDYQF